MTVKEQQLLLTYLGSAENCFQYDPGAIDGVFGPQTKEALTYFQQDFGITADGLYGPETDKALRHAVSYGMPERKQETAQSAEKPKGFWTEAKYAKFDRRMFRCPCGKCGGYPAEPQQALLDALVLIAEHFGVVPMIIPLPPADPHSGGSGVRCAAYNATLKGSVSNSRHLLGKAADIIMPGFSGSSVKSYCDYLVKTGKLRYCYVIGSGDSVHVDVI